MTLSELKSKVESQINPRTGNSPYLLREDIENAIDIVNNEKGGMKMFTDFLESIEGFEDERKILDDIKSYTTIL